MVTKHSSFKQLDELGMLDSVPIEISQSNAVITDKECLEQNVLVVKVNNEFKIIIELGNQRRYAWAERDNCKC